MFALRRSASRLLASRPASLLSPARSYTSFVAPSRSVLKQASAFQSPRRWASTETEKEGQTTSSESQVDTTQTTSEKAPRSTENAESRAADEYKPVNDSIPAIDSYVKNPANVHPEQAGYPDSGSYSTPADYSKKPTIYVGNIFFDVTESDLVKEFSQFGTINRCKIVRDSRGLSKGFAYIDFSNADEAEQALQTMNLQLYEGRRMTVQYAAKSSHSTSAPRNLSEPFPRNPPSKTLFIGNMSFEMTDRDLSNLFRGIRNVIDVRVAIDRRTGQPRGFAHADFYDIKSAMEAMKVLSEKETYGRKLRIDFSYSSSQSPRNARDPSGSPQTTDSGSQTDSGASDSHGRSEQ